MSRLFLTPLAPEDGPAVERLLGQTFGPHRKGLPSYHLRKGAPLDRLSWVARTPQGQVLGCLRFWQVHLSSNKTAPAGETLRCVLLGPLAVDLLARGAGVAHKLISLGLNRATDLGFDLCFVVGEPSLYRRFGFSNAAWSGVQALAPIPPRRLQVRELRQGGLQALGARSELMAFDPQTASARDIG